MQFTELGLIPPIAQAVAAQGYTEPTPIQARAIPHVLAARDLLGLAQTGTGKTAAFALPILQRLAGSTPSHGGPRGSRPIRCLVLTPTRELAAQIGESFSTYGKHLPLRNFVIFGGVGFDAQRNALRSGMDILVATPGRLLDLCSQGLVNLKTLEIFVLDEADRMLDMGFIHDVRKVIAMIPQQRQTLFFSATMPREAQQLADQLLVKPETVAVVPPSTTAERVDQEVYFVDKENKKSLLVDLLHDRTMSRVLVFSRTKHGANKIVEHLEKSSVSAEAIHGNKSQGARERALANFKAGKTRVLVATDIAARGIDIDEVTHVINFDVVDVPETYVHRIGRTARAGHAGLAMSFVEEEERPDWRNVERLMKKRVPVVEGHPFPPRGGSPTPMSDRELEGSRPEASKVPRPQGRGGGGGGRGGRPGGGGGGHGGGRHGGGGGGGRRHR